MIYIEHKSGQVSLSSKTHRLLSHLEQNPQPQPWLTSPPFPTPTFLHNMPPANPHAVLILHPDIPAGSPLHSLSSERTSHITLPRLSSYNFLRGTCLSRCDICAYFYCLFPLLESKLQKVRELSVYFTVVFTVLKTL